jgi:hypothetical protein
MNSSTSISSGGTDDKPRGGARRLRARVVSAGTISRRENIERDLHHEAARGINSPPGAFGG